MPDTPDIPERQVGPTPLAQRKGRRRRRTTKNADTSPANIRFRERVKEALEYRKLGYTFQEIADEMKFDVSYAYRLVKWGMDQITAEPAEDLKKMQSMRLEAMMTGVMDKAIAGDAEATQTCLNVMEMFNKLHGLLAAQKLEHSGEVQGGGNTVFIISEADAKL